jgi:hypothetical protein
MWNEIPLEKHHIVPKSRGGSNDASNLFLLCHLCHRAAPHTNDREYFLSWAKQRQMQLTSNRAGELSNLMSALGHDHDKWEVLLSASRLVAFGNKVRSRMYDEAIGGVSFHPDVDPFAWYRDEIVAVVRHMDKCSISTEQVEREVERLMEAYQHMKS